MKVGSYLRVDVSEAVEYVSHEVSQRCTPEGCDLGLVDYKLSLPLLPFPNQFAEETHSLQVVAEVSHRPTLQDDIRYGHSTIFCAPSELKMPFKGSKPRQRAFSSQADKK